MFLYSFSFYFSTVKGRVHKNWHEHWHFSSEYDFPKMAPYNSVRCASARRNTSIPKNAITNIISAPSFLLKNPNMFFMTSLKHCEVQNCLCYLSLIYTCLNNCQWLIFVHDTTCCLHVNTAIIADIVFLDLNMHDT